MTDNCNCHAGGGALHDAATHDAQDHYLRARIAEGRIRAALALLDHFDPTCGTGRTRTFVADLHHILDGAR